ncbi:MAG: hypothetical protein K0R72_610 [Clostridia bacterium]|jgi:hypothetical protein|nr:hypothetical protein [Clostridia bacterium]
MDKKIRKNIILCLVIILLFYFANSYTTAIFRVNKDNKYIDDNIKFKSPKDVALNFVNLMIDNNFDEAYKLLNLQTKSMFKSSDELKDYFLNNYININKNKEGILVVDKYSKIDNEYNVYSYVIVSQKYKSPKEYDPFYSESEFNIFSSIAVYEKSPVEYSIEINI